MIQKLEMLLALAKTQHFGRAAELLGLLSQACPQGSSNWKTSLG